MTPGQRQRIMAVALATFLPIFMLCDYGVGRATDAIVRIEGPAGRLSLVVWLAIWPVITAAVFVASPPPSCDESEEKPTVGAFFKECLRGGMFAILTMLLANTAFKSLPREYWENAAHFLNDSGISFSWETLKDWGPSTVILTTLLPVLIWIRRRRKTAGDRC